MKNKYNILIGFFIVSIIAIIIYMIIYNNVGIKKIVLENNSISISIGESKKINYTIEPVEASNQAIKWNSSNPNIAIVDDKGIVKGISVGDTDIIISTPNDKVVVKCHITVLDTKAQRIILSMTEKTLKVGDKTKLSVTIIPSTVTNQNIIYESTNQNIVTIDNKGNIEAIKEGTADIIVKEVNSNLEAKCKIVVEKVPEKTQENTIKIDRESAELLVGNTITLKLIVTPSKEVNVIWNSSNSNIATVDNTGKVVAKSKGVTTISATALGKTVTSKITVSDININSFNIHNDAVVAYFKNPNNVVNINDRYCDNTRCDIPRTFTTSLTGDVNIYQLNNNKELITTTSINNIHYYLIPNKTYYLESKSNPNNNETIKVVGKLRMINDKVGNFRDLGGWKADGGTIKYGKLYRSSNTNNISSNTIKYLNIKRIVSLLEEDEYDPSSNILDIIVRKPLDAYDIEKTDLRKALIEIMKAVISGKNTIFNCKYGKDRTGTVAYMIEGMLGVDLESRKEDYELSYFYDQNRTRNKAEFTLLIKAVNEFNQTNYEQERFINWFLKESNDKESDLELINKFRKAMIDGNPREYKLVGNKLVIK